VVPLWAGLRADVANLVLYTAVNFSADEGGVQVAKVESTQLLASG